jgi:plastocyanin
VIETGPVLGRLPLALSVVILVASACGQPDIVVRSEEPQGPAWFPQVVDVEGQTGAGVSLATDADGNPHLSYLSFPEEVPEGQQPPPPDPLAPVLPAVQHAHLVDDLWTRDPVAEEQGVDETSETAIAVDAEGTHHVTWTAGGQVLYASNAEGEFGQAEVVTAAAAAGLSIAADESGAPLIAFYDLLTDPEGPAALVRVAVPSGKGWEVETAAEADPSEPYGTGIAAAGAEPIVAYGDATGTLQARRAGQRWRSESVDPEGGLGVSVALDAAGVPHLAYVTPEGLVRHAHPAGGAWEINDVGEGATSTPTSIAVDAAGVHHIAWQNAEGLAYSTNAGGDFAGEPLPEATAGGARPRVGAGPEGEVFLAWFDAEDGELQMATRTEDQPLLAVPIPEETGAGGGPAPAECEPTGTALSLEAPPGAVTDGFATDCLAAPVGEAFTVDFNNADSVPHNFSIYTDDTASENLFEGEIVEAGASTTFQPDPIEEEGDLFFRCDLHPTTMTGTFVVAGGGQGGQ